MRKLTEHDITAILGTTVEGFTVEKVRIKSSDFNDSDHYGILLCKNDSGKYVTWQFHLVDEQPAVYWGHYHMENQDAAILDFNTRE